MQAPVFLLEIQHFKYLKSVFLKIYNCVSKMAFLKSSHIYILGVHESFIVNVSIFAIHKALTVCRLISYVWCNDIVINMVYTAQLAYSYSVDFYVAHHC